MADRTDNRTAVRNSAVAVALLLVFAARHYGYYLADGPARAHVWNIAGSIICLMFAAAVFLAYRSRLAALVLAWIAFEELQVIACGVAWLWRPWDVPADADVCSSLVGFNLAAVGLALITFLAIRLPVNSDR
jgi:uncharacterized membrane protein